jgi:hypothetical protein
MRIFLILSFVFFFNGIFISQISKIKDQKIEATWDQGIPFLLEDEYITNLTNQLTFDSLLINNKNFDKKSVKLCREIGIAFYNRGMYDAADWYLSRVKDYVEYVEIDPEKKEIKEVKKEEEKELNKREQESLKKDKEILSNLPKSYDNFSISEMENISKIIDNQIKILSSERDTLIKNNASKEVIEIKEGTINTLEKEKEVIDLSIDKNKLKKEKKILGIEKEELKFYLKWIVIIGSSIILILLVISQRKTIKVKDKEIDKQLEDINSKNTYLEHAARIIRHDMHSGINTYIPRGISSLEKRLTLENIKDLKIESPLKMIKEGLDHTQKVYKSVYEFTNLVKRNSKLDLEGKNIKNLLEDYFQKTSYRDQIQIENLGNLDVNPVLFCNALDNLVKNGLKYNKSEIKEVKIYREVNFIFIQDNGTGMDKEEFRKKIKNNKKNEKEDEGLGINIALAILREHGFSLDCEKNEIGTKMIIEIK